MQDLRLIERRDHTLILESGDGSEFTLDITDEVIQTVQSIHRSLQSKSNDTKVRPREVQTLLREGVAREEVAERLNIDIDDVERYADPIEAEFSFILEQALSVQVRADAGERDDPQFFGEVIEERLRRLGARDHVWRTWRDPEEGWLILLTFSSHGVDHEAKWAFEHRKRLLSPVTPDAVNLSKQGDVGDKLIPTLRAVDRPEERSAFDAEPFERAAQHDAPRLEEVHEVEDPPAFTKTEFERRLNIEQRAILTEPEPQDAGQNTDLLDALRKRRNERDTKTRDDTSTHRDGAAASSTSPAQLPAEDNPEAPLREPINIWAPPSAPATVEVADSQKAHPSRPSENETSAHEAPAEPKKKKGRQSIPSWDEILFGTRSEDE